MKRYDFIIAGAGASGLSLACHLVDSPLRDRSILIVDKSLHDHANKTWAFWEKAGRPPGARTAFDGLALHSWCQLLIANTRRRLALHTGPYTYKAIRSADFYPYAHRRLSEFRNVEFLEGDVDAVQESEDGASICVEGNEYRGRWVFDSVFRLPEFHPAPRHRYLKMQVQGWEIATDCPCFNPQMATFLDFRTAQPSRGYKRQRAGGVRFVYVLPYHEQYALVEHVACIPAEQKLMREREEEQSLKNYIERTLGITGYTILREEQGVNPMTSYPFPRRRSRHVMPIGIAGGMLKPSTGFAFARIQRDSEAIVRSLLKHGHPFDVPRTGWPYRLFEPLMLWLMAEHGDIVGPMLGMLFKVGRTHRILDFLDEQGLPL
jgi:lycopene beta-cyclase